MGGDRVIDFFSRYVSIGGELPSEMVYTWGSPPVPVWEFLVKHGVEINENNLVNTIKFGDLEVLKWMRARAGCPWHDQFYFDRACTHFNRGIMEYFKSEIGLFWTETSGDLFTSAEGIMWALANGCPDATDYESFCIRSHSDEVVMWAVEANKLVPSAEFVEQVATFGSLKSLKWLLQRMDPEDPKIPDILQGGLHTSDLYTWKFVVEEKGREISLETAKSRADYSLAIVSLSSLLWLESKGVLEFNHTMLTSMDPRIRKLGERLQKKIMPSSPELD